jgi:protein-S-isoprenylcysteine O-methyltransferase Ste14
MHAFLQFFMPVFIILYLGVAFVGRSWIVYRRTGINPFVLGTSDSAHDFIGRIFKFTTASLLVVIFTYALWPTAYIYFGPLMWLDRTWVQALGIVLLLASFAWTATAQAQMGDSWRIGIDHQRETDLVQTGIYARSRNPIFVGMRVTMLGVFLCLPNALTLSVLVLSDVLIQIQVRLEEEHLHALHGDAYNAYRSRVRRWL